MSFPAPIPIPTDPGELAVLRERFFANVAIFVEGCWLWTAAIKKKEGYGAFKILGKVQRAHRVAWLLVEGVQPTKGVLDHLCRTRSCVNPEHLDEVSVKVNTLRGEGPTAAHAKKTHCKRGHEFTAENTKKDSAGRRCATCIRLRSRKGGEECRATATPSSSAT